MLLWVYVAPGLTFTLSAMVCGFLAEAAPAATLSLLQQRERGEVELKAEHFLAVFVLLSLSGSLLGACASFFQAKAGARRSVAIRAKIDQTLIALAQPYFWTREGELAPSRLQAHKLIQICTMTTV
jgi:hypothetical protein